MSAPLDVTRAGPLAQVSAARTSLLLHAVRRLADGGLEGPSQLAGWSRLTIVCHLRYGTHALLRMTQDTLAGRQTAYYPEGRERQRPATLIPARDEGGAEVINDWEHTASELDRVWATMDAVQWAAEIVEPPEHIDLGRIPLARLALARLTEVDVHGTDLGIGFPDWSRTLVEVALPTRLGWLTTRRTNHRAFDRSLQGSWLLAATDGPRWLVTVDGDHVDSRPADASDEARAVITGSSRDLLALLLGRPPGRTPRFDGDVAFAKAFERAFPGP